MPVYLECAECLSAVLEFPSRDFCNGEDLEFECPKCGAIDNLLKDETVQGYADEFNLQIKDVPDVV